MIHKNIFYLFSFLLIVSPLSCDKKNNSEIKPIIKKDTVVSKEIKTIQAIEEIKSVTTNSTSNNLEGIKKVDTEKIKKNTVSIIDYPIYNNLKILLNHFEIGEKQTKEEIKSAKIVPDEALKIVKSVTKISENELAIEWKSTWLIEKISDVKFNDGTIKLNFNEDLIYTSGNAIGIKYRGEIYTDLKIKKNKAYIPSVKEYCWKIGK